MFAVLDALRVLDAVRECGVASAARYALWDRLLGDGETSWEIVARHRG